MNLQFNRLGNLCGVVGNSWGREIARTLSIAAAKHFEPLPRGYTSLTVQETEDVRLWIGEPDTVRALQGIVPHQAPRLPVEHAPTTILLADV